MQTMRILEAILDEPMTDAERVRWEMRLIEAETELDSPGFTPAALQEFKARGFVRRNRRS